MLVDSNRKKLTEILSLLYSSAVTSEVNSVQNKHSTGTYFLRIKQNTLI